MIVQGGDQTMREMGDDTTNSSLDAWKIKAFCISDVEHGAGTEGRSYAGKTR